MARKHEATTTSNGFEIQNPVDKLDAAAMRALLGSEFGIDGKSPGERVEQLKRLSQEGIAILLEALNKGVQGSGDSLMKHEGAMHIGEQATIAPEYRYDVFSSLIDDIKAAPADINPERIADTLALGTVLLHPFHDGNGRTARVIGLVFRDDYDNPAEYDESFNTVAEPRDEARARGGYMIYGYIPRLPESADQSNPEDVKRYLHSLLTDDSLESPYISCYGTADLRLKA